MACGPKGNAAGRVGSGRTLSLSPARTGKEEDPDERGSPGGETGRGGGRWAGLGQETGNGPAWEKKWAAGERRKKKKRDWAGLEREIEEERFSIFQNDSNTFNLNSNSKI